MYKFYAMLTNVFLGLTVLNLNPILQFAKTLGILISKMNVIIHVTKY